MYIVRHGETEGNVKRILQGHADTPLTKPGIRQANETAKKLKDIKFDKIYSSDIGRALKTTEIVRLERKLAIETSELLRERDYRTYSGKAFEVLNKDLEKYMKKLDLNSHEEKWKNRFPGIEGNEEMVSRFIRFLREVSVGNPGKIILIGTHAGLMENLLIHLGVWNYQDLYKKNVHNAGYLKIRSDGIDFFIEKSDGVDGL